MIYDISGVRYDEQLEEVLDQAYENYVAKKGGSTMQRKRAKKAYAQEDQLSEVCGLYGQIVCACLQSSTCFSPMLSAIRLCWDLGEYEISVSLVAYVASFSHFEVILVAFTL